MRIAVSGAHRTGKTTLVEELHRLLPTYTIVDEPYYLLAQEGYEFAEMPSLEDFEAQLERSLESAAVEGDEQIFDRCPADILAYLITHHDSRAFDVEPWIRRIREAMSRLDLVVFVPIAGHDRASPLAAGDGVLRRRVDEELRDILLEDRWSFSVEVLEVAGTSEERARQVLKLVVARRTTRH
jgi:nicotinamide riboside kinase